MKALSQQQMRLTRAARNEWAPERVHVCAGFKHVAITPDPVCMFLFESYKDVQP